MYSLEKALFKEGSILAKMVAITQASTSLAEVESRFSLRRSADNRFFEEWKTIDEPIEPAKKEALSIVYRRLQYHRADGELLEGAVTLLVVAPLLELSGFYDPPFKLRSEASVEIAIDDGEETLRGRIDALILQGHLWVIALEAKKTTIPLRSALPQLLTYLMANPKIEQVDSKQPGFGVITNGDEVLFVKVVCQPSAQYGLSRAFSIYTDASEIFQVLSVLKAIGQTIV